MKRYAKTLLVSLVLLVAVLVAVVAVRQDRYATARAQGYLTGYTLGRQDGEATRETDAQELALSVAPYEFGSSRWKGFMVGFPEGYAAGLQSDTNNEP